MQTHLATTKLSWHDASPKAGLLGGCCALLSLLPAIDFQMAGLMKQQVEQGLVPRPGDGSGAEWTIRY